MDSLEMILFLSCLNFGTGSGRWEMCPYLSLWTSGRTAEMDTIKVPATGKEAVVKQQQAQNELLTGLFHNSRESREPQK